MSVTNRRDIGIQTHTFPALETRKLDFQGPQNSSGTTNRDHQWLLKRVRKSWGCCNRICKIGVLTWRVIFMQAML